MATRTISTKLAIEGESEYRSSLARINGELKNLRSTLKLAESEFKGNANSVEALIAKGKALNDLFEKQKEKVKNAESALKTPKMLRETTKKKYRA